MAMPSLIGRPEMPLTLRPTRLSSPVYADQLDYTVIEDGREIGCLY
jgi:hypothetical protein